MTADTHGGVWTYALDVAQALQEYGVEITLATMGETLSEAQHDAVARVRNIDVVPSGFKLEWMDEPWADVALAGDWLLELARRVKPDIVHLNGYCHGSLKWNAPVLVVAHSCVLSWWNATKGEAAPSRWKRYHREVYWGLAGANLVVAPTQAMLDLLTDNYQPLQNTRVIPNGRDPSGFPPAEQKRPVIFTAGRIWDEAKNIPALEAVAPLIAWPIFVAGENHHPDGSRATVRNLKFLGVLPPADLADWFSSASIYVSPARYEPFGLSALEAALAGCALVLGDIPSLREVWGDAALFVPPDDLQALRAALSEVINDDARREEMGRRARARALEYSIERMGRGYFEAYSELVECASQPRVAVPPAA